MKDQLIALIGAFDNATLDEIEAAHKELSAIATDMLHLRYTRRIAAALAAVCEEALRPRE